MALETTLIAHGVPRAEARTLNHDLARIVRDENAVPTLVGVVRGEPIIGMTDAELSKMLDAEHIPKLNTANLGLAIQQGWTGATTVSATMELAAAGNVRLFATGGIGGVHFGYAHRLDISADLAALSRFPVAVVCSGVKSIIDVESTREALETLGVPVVGFRTDAFPAFYLRASDATVDARFDDEPTLAQFLAEELRRTGRGVLIANPVPEESELDSDQFHAWLEAARAETRDAQGRDVSPRLLASLHQLSDGATLRTNIDLVRSNTRLAARLAARLGAEAQP